MPGGSAAREATGFTWAWHGADHVIPAFVSPSVTVPVVAGALALGTWQSLVVVDPNRDNRTRRVRFSFLPG